MKRYWFAVIIAILVACVIAGGTLYIRKVSLEMEQLIQSAEKALREQDGDTALQKLQEGEKLWQQRQNLLEAVLDHTAVENVSIPLSEAVAYLEYGQPVHCAANCKALIQTLQDLRDGQQFSFYNLF